jgi:hypothetical protein
MSDRVRIGAGLVVVAAAVVLFVVLRGSDDNSNGGDGASAPPSKNAGDGTTAETPPIPVIRLKGGEPVGGPGEVVVTSGDRARFTVTSDIDGEVHVHGYDFEKPVKAGGSVRFDFPAKLEGGFEIELHHGGGENEIAELKVEPG